MTEATEAMDPGWEKGIQNFHKFDVNLIVIQKPIMSALSLFTEKPLRSWAKLSKSKFILLLKLISNNQCPTWVTIDGHYWAQRIAHTHSHNIYIYFIMKKETLLR